MEEKDLSEIRKIMKWVFLGSALVYALIILAVYTLIGDALSNNMKFIVVCLAPMVVGGIALLILKSIKNRTGD